MMTYPIGEILEKNLWVFDFCESFISKPDYDRFTRPPMKKHLKRRPHKLVEALWVSRKQEDYPVTELFYKTFNMLKGMSMKALQLVNESLQYCARPVLEQLIEMNQGVQKAMSSMDVLQIISETTKRYGMNSVVSNYAENDGEKVTGIISKFTTLDDRISKEVDWDPSPIDSEKRKREAIEGIAEYHGKGLDDLVYFTDKHRMEKLAKEMLKKAGAIVIDNYKALEKSLNLLMPELDPLII